MEERVVSGWWYVLGGLALGVAVGLLLAPPVEGEEEGEGLGRRLLRRIPRRVKIAGAVGAVKGGGGEAYREAKESVREKLSG